MKQPDALIVAMKNGDQKAFAQLYNMYSLAIFGVINTIVKEEKVAEEIQQDVFVKVWENASSYSVGKGRFFTWLLNIARNAAIDHTRSKSHKNTQKNLSTTNFVDILSGSDNLNRKTDAIGIRRFVDTLKPACIKIIDFIYFKGFTQKNTAEALKIPLGTVKTRARNCIKDLRSMILGEA